MKAHTIGRLVRAFGALALLALLIGQSAGGAQAAGRLHTVYTSTNDAGANAVVALVEQPDGTLSQAGSFATGGKGAGTGLGSQGALALAAGGRLLLVVNAGSNNVSLFAVRPSGLELLDTAPSSGVRPISLTVHGDLVYVLNAGNDTISGLRIARGRTLEPLAGSTRPLSGSGVAPAQVSFSPDGAQLVVTEKGTKKLDVYQVNDAGLASSPNVQPSSGQTPFGFAFSPRGDLVVSEAFGGAPTASAASSYTLTADGALVTRSGSVPTHQTAACWVAITPDSRYAYTANTGSGNISAYRLAADGTLVLLGDGAAGVTGAGSKPADLALDRSGDILFVLAGGTHEVQSFQISGDGSLSRISIAGGLSPVAAGLVAR